MADQAIEFEGARHYEQLVDMLGRLECYQLYDEVSDGVGMLYATPRSYR